jgi:ABC-type branched-subunit amino acid transport system substrate-binding protein
MASEMHRDSQAIGGSRLRKACGAFTLIGAIGLALLPTTSGAASAASGESIVVGGEGALAVNQGASQGFEAGIYQFNKSGGLDGRKIKYIGFLDDNFSPATATSNIQQLILDDHVFAVAPFNSNVATDSVTQLSIQNKTPLIGQAVSPPYVANPWAWGITGNLAQPTLTSTAQFAQYFKAIHATHPKLAIIGYDNPTAVTAGNGAIAAAKSLGATIVYKNYGIPSMGETNYEPFAQGIASSGANAVYYVLAGSDVLGMSNALKALNFKGAIESGASYYPGQLAASPSEEAALQGIYVANEMPANSNNTPAVLQAEKDLRATGAPPYLTTGASIGYWSAQLLISMLRATEQSVGSAAKVTPQAVEKVVNKGYVYKGALKGGVGNLTFPEAEHSPGTCDTMLQVEGSNYVQRVPYLCNYKVVHVPASS